jgi:Holliday junction resolvase
MVNKNKIKGSKWERDAIKQLAPHARSAKRIPGSGALGTILMESRLTSDGIVEYEFLPKPIKLEMKYGYGGSTQMTIKREWMEKVRKEALQTGALSAVLLKFRDVTGGDIESSKWVCFSVEDWNRIVSHLNDLFSDMKDYWDYKYEKAKSDSIK